MLSLSTFLKNFNDNYFLISDDETGKILYPVNDSSMVEIFSESFNLSL